MKKWIIKNHGLGEDSYLHHFDAHGQPIWGPCAEALAYDTEDLGTPIGALAKASRPEIDEFTVERSG